MHPKFYPFKFDKVMKMTIVLISERRNTMNTFQKASITSLLSTFALVSSALAAENEGLQFTQEQIFNSDK